MGHEARKLAERKTLEKWEQVQSYLDRIFDNAKLDELYNWNDRDKLLDNPELEGHPTELVHHALGYFIRRLKERAPVELTTVESELSYLRSTNAAESKVAEADKLADQWNLIVESLNNIDLVEKDLTDLAEAHEINAGYR